MSAHYPNVNRQRGPPLYTGRTLDLFTGSPNLKKSKKETRERFQPSKNQTHINGAPVFRPEDNRYVFKNQNNVQPSEPQRVGPGIGLGFHGESSGGLHDTSRIVMSRDFIKRKHLDSTIKHGAATTSGFGAPAMNYDHFDKKGPSRIFENEISKGAPKEHVPAPKFRSTEEGRSQRDFLPGAFGPSTKGSLPSQGAPDFFRKIVPKFRKYYDDKGLTTAPQGPNVKAHSNPRVQQVTKFNEKKQMSGSKGFGGNTGSLGAPNFSSQKLPTTRKETLIEPSRKSVSVNPLRLPPGRDAYSFSGNHNIVNNIVETYEPLDLSEEPSLKKNTEGNTRTNRRPVFETPFGVPLIVTTERRTPRGETSRPDKKVVHVERTGGALSVIPHGVGAGNRRVHTDTYFSGFRKQKIVSEENFRHEIYSNTKPNYNFGRPFLGNNSRKL